MTRPKAVRRAVLAPLTAVGVALVVGSFVTPWFRSSLSVWEGQGSYDTQTHELPLGEIDDWWSLTYQVAVSVLVALIVLAVIGRGRAKVVAGVGARPAALVVGAAVMGGWIDVLDARQTFTDLVDGLQGAAPNSGYVVGSVGQTGVILATIAWVALAVAVEIATRAARPDRADVMEASEQPG